MHIAQQWLQAKRYSVAADMGLGLKEHSDVIIAQRAAQIQVLAAIGMEDPNAISLASDFVKNYPNAIGANQIYFKAGGTFLE